MTSLVKYCGIIIVRGGPMLVDFIDHSYSGIYITMNMVFFSINLYKQYSMYIIYPLLMKLRPQKPEKFGYPWTLTLWIKLTPQYSGTSL
jgi:hypothetical protein